MIKQITAIHWECFYAKFEKVPVGVDPLGCCEHYNVQLYC